MAGRLAASEREHVAGAIVILGALLLKTVVDHLFPKKPDVFQQIKDLQKSLDAIIEVSENNQRDLTALKMGAIKR